MAPSAPIRKDMIPTFVVDHDNNTVKVKTPWARPTAPPHDYVTQPESRLQRLRKKLAAVVKKQPKEYKEKTNELWYAVNDADSKKDVVIDDAASEEARLERLKDEARAEWYKHDPVWEPSFPWLSRTPSQDSKAASGHDSIGQAQHQDEHSEKGQDQKRGLAPAGRSVKEL